MSVMSRICQLWCQAQVDEEQLGVGMVRETTLGNADEGVHDDDHALRRRLRVVFVDELQHCVVSTAMSEATVRARPRMLRSNASCILSVSVLY